MKTRGFSRFLPIARILCYALHPTITYALPTQELLVDKHNIKIPAPDNKTNSKEPIKPDGTTPKKRAAAASANKTCDEVNSTKDDEFFAPAGSTFTILEKKEQKFFARFKKISQDFRELPAQIGDQRRAGRCLVHAEYAKYEIELSDSDYKFSHGWAHGPLSIPFKLQISDGSIAAAGNIGYFIGYRFLTYFTFVPVAGGFGVVNAGEPTAAKNPLMALTLAAGFTFDLGQNINSIGKGIQLGVFVGLDHANGYAYSDKPWVSIGIGYNFNPPVD